MGRDLSRIVPTSEKGASRELIRSTFYGDLPIPKVTGC